MNVNWKRINLFVIANVILPNIAVLEENKQGLFFSGYVSHFSSEWSKISCPAFERNCHELKVIYVRKEI